MGNVREVIGNHRKVSKYSLTQENTVAELDLMFLQRERCDEPNYNYYFYFLL